MREGDGREGSNFSLVPESETGTKLPDGLVNKTPPHHRIFDPSSLTQKEEGGEA